MPRKDRRFTAADIQRLYCRNLSTPQQLFVREGIELCYASGPLTDDAVAEFLDILAEVLSDAQVPAIPSALKILAAAIRSADPSDIDRLIDSMGLVGEPTA